MGMTVKTRRPCLDGGVAEMGSTVKTRWPCLDGQVLKSQPTVKNVLMVDWEKHGRP